MCPQYEFTDVVNPKRGDGNGQQEMIEAVGISQFSRFQIKTAGLIITETLFDVHALQVIFQGMPVRRQIHGDGAQLRGLLGCGARPRDRQVTEPIGFSGLADVLKIARATRLDAQHVDSEHSAICQRHGRVIRDPDAVIPAQFPAFLRPILVPEAAIG